MRKRFHILISVLILLLIFGCLPEKKRVYIRKPRPAKMAVKKAAPVKKAPEETEITEEPEATKEPEAAKEFEYTEEPEIMSGEGIFEGEFGEYEFIEYRTAKDLFYSAVNNYNNDEYDTASILFDQIIKLFPNDSIVEDCIAYQGKILFKKESYENAIDKFEELKILYPGTSFTQEADYYIYLIYKELGREGEAFEKMQAFLQEYSEGKFLADVLLDAAYEDFMAEENVESLKKYIKYYNISEDEQVRADAYETIIYIVDNILTTEELESITDTFYEKFPAAYIKLKLAKSYLDEQNIDSAKYTLIEIDEFFPTFEGLDEVQELLERIEERLRTNADVIACLLPLSGKYEVYGKRLLAGVLLAADVFNEGEIEHPVTIIVKDTKGEPDTALSMLDETYEKDKVIAVIGPLLSKNAQVCADRAEKLKLPIMLLTQKEDVTMGYDYVYRKFISNSKQVSSLVDYAIFDRDLSRFAILYPNNTYGEELKELFFNEVIKFGGNIVAVESYDTDKSDFSDEIKKIVGRSDLSDRRRLRKIWIEEVLEKEAEYMQKRMEKGEVTELQIQDYLDGLEKELKKEEYRPVVDFQAIFVPDKYSRAGLIIPQLLYHDIDKDILKLGTNSYNSKKLIDIARDNANGIVFVDGFFKDSGDEHVKGFVKEYEETFKTIPTLLEAESYDSAKIIIGLIRENNILDRKKLKEAIDKLKEYEGVTGRVKSFKDGDADEDLTLLTVRHESIREFKPIKYNEYILHDLKE